MPRNVSGIYALPGGSVITNGDTSDASDVNTPLADIVDDLNAARPVVAGGTGATTAAGAQTNLGGTTVGKALFTAADAAAARTAIGAALRGHIFGLTLSNNSTDANNDIDIAAGEAASDDTSPVLMALASGITKRLDAAWAVGDGNGGLDTGTKANSTWYHMHLIRRSDTGVVDVLFSASASSPTMPTNYDQKRRIGAVYSDSSGNILPFVQRGDEFLWVSLPSTVTANNPGTTAALRTLLVPNGVQVEALFSACLICTGTDGLYLSSPDVNDVSAIANAAISLADAGGRTAADFRIRTNTSSQVRTRLQVGTSADIYLVAKGWVDHRGASA